MKHRFLPHYIGLSLLLAANLVAGYIMHRQAVVKSGEVESAEAIRQYQFTLKVIRDHYVDEEKTGYKDLVHDSLQGMLQSLDPFSAFIPPPDFTAMEEDTEGEFGGIGVFIGMENERLTIIEPMEGSPGEKAGLKPRDQVVAVNGDSIIGLSMEDAVSEIKGPPGSSVDLTIFRPSTKETLEMTFERAIIPVPSVTDAHFIREGIAFFRILQFNRKTPDEVLSALTNLQKEGEIKGIIMDLRYNPGGLLIESKDVCSLFLPEGDLIVYTEGRDPARKDKFYASDGPKFLAPAMAILINGGSASGAEIVAGCLQDTKRAILVGTKSYGKGSVQNVISLRDGSAIRLTTAKYYTPSSRVIHGKGIEPDIEVKVEDESTFELYRMGRGADAEPTEFKDTQVKAALDNVTQQIERRQPQP